MLGSDWLRLKLLMGPTVSEHRISLWFPVFTDILIHSHLLITLFNTTWIRRLFLLRLQFFHFFLRSLLFPFMAGIKNNSPLQAIASIDVILHLLYLQLMICSDVQETLRQVPEARTLSQLDQVRCRRLTIHVDAERTGEILYIFPVPAQVYRQVLHKHKDWASMLEKTTRVTEWKRKIKIFRAREVLSVCNIAP